MNFNNNLFSEDVAANWANQTSSKFRALEYRSIRYDWLVPLHWSTNQTNEVMRLTHRTIDNYMINYYGEIPASFLARFNHFQNRMHIIQRALEHHLSGDFISSIPLLIIQCEGILCELLNVRRIATLESLNREFQRTSQRRSPFNRAFRHYIANRVDTFYREDHSNQGRLIRSTIVHGHELSYDNEINSSKCVNWLEYLFGLSEDLVYLNTRNDTLHLWHCEQCPVHGTPRRIYYRHRAELTRYRRCEMCFC